MDIVIREIAATDADAAAALSGELGYPSTPADIARRIEEITRSSDQAVYVACIEGKVAGWIDICVTRHLAADPRVEIAGLVVSRQLRSSGIGKALVSRAEAWALEHGLTDMLVRSRSTREAAHRFYLREGYTINKMSTVFTKQLAKP